jgi:hypothetical protein
VNLHKFDLMDMEFEAIFKAILDISIIVSDTYGNDIDKTISLEINIGLKGTPPIQSLFKNIPFQ